MKCPFELPVKPIGESFAEGIYFKAEDNDSLTAFLCLTESSLDYIVQAINSYEKLVNVCRNASTSLAITMLPKLDNSVASNDNIIKVVILSLEQVLKEAEKPK